MVLPTILAQSYVASHPIKPRVQAEPKIVPCSWKKLNIALALEYAKLDSGDEYSTVVSQHIWTSDWYDEHGIPPTPESHQYPLNLGQCLHLG